MRYFILLIITCISSFAYAQIILSEPIAEIQQKEYYLQEKYDRLLRGASRLENYFIIKENGKLRLENNTQEKLCSTTFDSANFLLSNYIPNNEVQPFEYIKNTCLYQIPYLQKKDSILIITQKQKLVTLKWNKNYIIKPVPFVYNDAEFYVILDTTTANYGLMTRDGVIVLQPIYYHLFDKRYCEAAVSDFKNCINFITELMYPTYIQANFHTLDSKNTEIELVNSNYKDANTANTNDFHYPFISVPKFIYIYKLNSKKELLFGLFDLEKQKIILEPKYNTIENKGDNAFYVNEKKSFKTIIIK